MLAKKTYDMSEKEILQLEREWYAGRYIGNTEKYYDKCYGRINLFVKKE